MAATPRKMARSLPVSERHGNLWAIVVTAMVLIRFLVPTEGAEQGQTLWIATGWLALLTVRFWWLTRYENWHPPAFHPVDAGVMLLIGGNCLSGLLVLFGEGDRRAALNCTWEWLAIGATWFVLRDMFRSVEFRLLLTRSLAGLCVVLALFGLWQHFVWYPQQTQELNDLFSLREMLEQHQVLTTSEQKRYQELVSRFGSEFFSLDEIGQKALLNRAVHSVEPIGRFALANSFAALLIAGFFLSLQMAARAFQSGMSKPGRFLSIAVILVITACLILTKSRTAIIGVVLVVAWQSISLGLHRSGAVGRRIQIALAVVLVLLLLAGLLIWTGGLDREVLSEAPKSLQYRLEYWQGTWGVIQDHPVFGIGPGNFRQHYLKHKLPGSSEEILDPHNLFLDAWSQGGLLALFGVLTLIAVWVRYCFARPEPEWDGSSVPLTLVEILGVGVLSCGLVFVEEWLFEGFTDQTILVLGAIWIGIACLLQKLIPAAPISQRTALAICGALMIHLLGAGGLSMPAILLLLLLMILFLLPAKSFYKPASNRWIWCGVVTGLVLTVGCIWSSLLPVFASSLLTQRGRAVVASQGNVRSAEQSLREAIAADSLSADPHQQLAMLLMHRWRANQQDSAIFNAAVESQMQAIERDPFSGKRWFALGEYWMERYRHEPVATHAEEAVRAFESGIARYPEYAPLWAQLAIAEEAAHQPASAAARKALELDDLNRRNQHFDRLLASPIRDQLEKIAN